jgi:hypothetical protein
LSCSETTIYNNCQASCPNRLACSRRKRRAKPIFNVTRRHQCHTTQFRRGHVRGLGRCGGHHPIGSVLLRARGPACHAPAARRLDHQRVVVGGAVRDQADGPLGGLNFLFKRPDNYRDRGGSGQLRASGHHPTDLGSGGHLGLVALCPMAMASTSDQSGMVHHGPGGFMR